MDPEEETQEFLRQQDQQFWDDKRRDEQQQRPRRPRTDDLPADATDSLRDSAVTAAHATSFGDGERRAPVAKKKGRPALAGAVVLLLVLAAAAAVTFMWSPSWLPFGTKHGKGEPVADVALAAPVATVTLPPLPDVSASQAPALSAPADAAAAMQAMQAPQPVPVDPQLLEQIGQLEKRLAQLIAGFKAQGYIKEAAGQEGAELQVADFVPHPSTVAPPAPVAAQARPRLVRRAAPPPAPPKPTHQVLSIDMWDGRPSVVVGVVGAPTSQVRVLQPGDSYNGARLTSVDVAGQRATFTDGVRSVSIAVEGSQ